MPRCHTPRVCSRRGMVLGTMMSGGGGVAATALLHVDARRASLMREERLMLPSADRDVAASNTRERMFVCRRFTSPRKRRECHMATPLTLVAVVARPRIIVVAAEEWWSERQATSYVFIERVP